MNFIDVKVLGETWRQDTGAGLTKGKDKFKAETTLWNIMSNMTQSIKTDLNLNQCNNATPGAKGHLYTSAGEYRWEHQGQGR